ncbi:hypothetical protein Taro_037168 [Colocasia esculenta]|uniref:Uncharacterized protein n=1 Tax=Colocasia esculenta TaxID=4460 RepID=A0A843WAD8_COLES|nr:hypothetical protein [Colocasia esculenta]
MQIATGSHEDRGGSVRLGARTRWGFLSRSDRNKWLYHDGPENATYRAIMFSGSELEFEREKDRASGLELEELRMKLDEALPMDSPPPWPLLQGAYTYS